MVCFFLFFFFSFLFFSLFFLKKILSFASVFLSMDHHNEIETKNEIQDLAQNIWKNYQLNLKDVFFK